MCGDSSDPSLQSGSPSHTNVGWIQSPLLHVNWAPKHVRLAAAGGIMVRDDQGKATEFVTVFVLHHVCCLVTQKSSEGNM